MTVIYTTPVERPDETQTEVVFAQIDTRNQRAAITVERRNADGEKIDDRQYNVGDRPDDNYTWAQFVGQVPSLGTLRAEIEQALITAGEIPPGTVT